MYRIEISKIFKKIVDNLQKKEYSISNFKSTLKGDDWE